MLEEKKVNIPSILQSLGCIAQIAMPIFETRKEEIISFITKKILECNDVRFALFKFSILFCTLGPLILLSSHFHVPPGYGSKFF